MRRLPAAVLVCALALLSHPGFAQQITVSPSGGSPWVPISAQSVSNAASIQWTGLGSTYNNYFLACTGVYPATNSTVIYLQFGEGGTPTWETANYAWAGPYLNSGSTTVSGSASAGTTAGFDIGEGGIPNSPLAGVLTFEAYIFNFASTTLYTHAHYRQTVQNSSGTAYYSMFTSGFYIGDTGAKTAIRLIAATGNLTAACNLLGLALP